MKQSQNGSHRRNNQRGGKRNYRQNNSGGSGRRQYDSNGPKGKIRGYPNQLHDKYVGYAQDALSSGDLIEAEGFFQFADHYYRIGLEDGSTVNGQGSQKGSQKDDQKTGTRQSQGQEPSGAQKDASTDAVDDQKSEGSTQPKSAGKRGRSPKPSTPEMVEDAFSAATMPSFLNAGGQEREDEDVAKSDETGTEAAPA